MKFSSAIEKNAHLARVQLERHANHALVPAQSEDPQLTQDDIDAAAARVFTTTLLDISPDPNLVPTLSIEDLVDSIGRLNLSNGSQHMPAASIPPEPSSSSPLCDIVDGVSRLALTSPTNFPEPLNGHNSATPLPYNPQPSSPILPQRSSPKRDRHRKSQQAMNLLKTMELRLSVAREKLAMPSHEILCQVESEITAIRQALDKILRRTESVDTRKQLVFEMLRGLNTRVTELRNAIPDTRRSPIIHDSSHHYELPIDECTSAAQVSIFLGVVCSVIMGVSRRAGDLVMGLICMIIHLVAAKHDGSMDPLQTRTLKQVPRSIHEALSRFNLEGHSTVYAICPACHCTYKPLFDAGRCIYPERCTNRPDLEGGPCNERLVDDFPEGLQGSKPIKPFVYHHFADYLAGILSQHEDEMDRACDDCFESLQHPPPSFVNNVFDAEFIRNFEGPVPGTLFIDRPGTEGRYLFALNVDFFNVEGLRIRGASTSCGIISMACLNLSINIRYQPENMYLVGIIPGPSEPHLTDLNHYLRPLIDDMVKAWENGIHFTRTPNHPDGRDARSAIAAAVNDLPAARKVSALAGHGSYFYCSVCECCHLSTRGCTNFQDWKIRDHKEMRKQAEAWRDTTSTTQRNKLFQRHGVRWSELWRLSYWNPTRQLVVDSMHCILEGLAQHQSRDLLCLTSAAAAEKPQVIPPFEYDFSQVPEGTQMKEREAKHVGQIHALLTAPIGGGDIEVEVENNLDKLFNKLLSKNLRPLKFVVEDLGLVVEPDPSKRKRSVVVKNSDGSTQERPVLKKNDLARALVIWVSSFLSNPIFNSF